MTIRDTTIRRIKAFRRALELGADELSSECRHMDRWSTELHNFPGGCCDLASHCLALYLIQRDRSLHPHILHMADVKAFRDASGSTVKSHVIVALDGNYIDLTLDQFDEYDNWVLNEPIESGGKLGELIRQKIAYSEPSDLTITSRKISLSAFNLNGKNLFNWLKNTADKIMLADGFKYKAEPTGIVSFEVPSKYRDFTLSKTKRSPL